MVTLCEIKYYNDEFIVDKRYASILKNKISLFEEITNTKKQVQLALVTMNGMKRNIWSEELVNQVVDVSKFFI